MAAAVPAMDASFRVKIISLGLNENQATRFAGEGITDQSNFLLLDAIALEELFNAQGLVSVNTLTRMKLRSLWSWAQEKDSAEIEPNLDDFDEATMKAQMKKMSRETKKSSAIKTPPTKDTGKALEPFSGKRKHWKDFEIGFMAYIGTMKNEDNVPLTYIIRDEDNPDLGPMGERIATAPLQGRVYTEDNYQVYQLLRTYTSAGDAYVHISKHPNDGRAAWIELKSFYEGENARSGLIEEARKKIRESHYDGEK